MIGIIHKYQLLKNFCVMYTPFYKSKFLIMKKYSDVYLFVNVPCMRFSLGLRPTKDGWAIRLKC